ncbi:hypothetical protein H2200_007432 [Cladophialophora chaetospira]|uniref:TeaA receptor TeaR n=1 Tax=Cladophialophora chaetospira TaxID=386627 RepID=A0AA39CHG4_9EURO|nr:hypothetical protein H2200_007432 [Cladophialophora chaetospira]
MAEVISPGSTTMVVNGARAQYDTVGAGSQENATATKNRPNGTRQNSSGSTRSPLSALAPNRKESGSVNGRLAPHNRIEELGQRDGSLIRSGSEPDSLLDLYKSNPSSGNVSQSQPDNDIPENMYRPAEDDPEGWIHRDKLAKIESEELQAAGINLAKARRTTSKSGQRDTSRGRRSDDRNTSEHRKVETEEPTIPRLTEEPGEEAEQDEQIHWDLRTPEEIAAESTPSPIYSNPVLRKSGSKIPVLTSSPLPIPQERIERDTPIVRKRTISNSMSPEDGIPVLKTRMRRGSTGSQPLQDEGDSTLVTTPTATKLLTPKTSSPTKTRTKTAAAQGSPPGTSSGRKTSGTTRKPSTNPKLAGTPTPTQRPGTRSGELDRPRTAVNRPEGDPPWLATMYKPDPRLPPDEQIIPTHARRQQQAQWEDQGAVPRTYDRNFSPLAIHTGNGQVKSTSPLIPSPPEPEKESADGEGGNAWPLKPTPSTRNSGTGSIRPGTGGSTNGGYSTMPRVTNPVQSPRMGSITSVPGQPPPRMQVQRMQDTDTDEKVKEKSCGCCVVM